MSRIFAILLLVVAFGCGDSGTPAVDAAAPILDETAAPGAEANFGSADAAASIEKCMDLVSAERYAEALTTCTIAAQQAPDDGEVQMALQVARENAGDPASTAGAAVTGEIEDATGTVSGAIEDVTGAAGNPMQDE